MSLDSAKRLLAANGFEPRAAERIIATAGLHEGRLKDIAAFDAPARVKERVSKYLAIYPPAVVVHAIKSGANLGNNRQMSEIVKSHGKNYLVDHSRLPPFKRIVPEPCSAWSEKLKDALKSAVSVPAKGQPFPGRLALKCSGELASETEEGYRKGGFSLVLYPSKEEERRLEKEGARLDYNYRHEPGSLGFARFYVNGDRLIVSSVQSDLYRPEWHDSPKTRNAIRRRYKLWGNCLLASLAQMAKNAGLKEVVMVTAEHQGEKFSMDPQRMFQTYSELPQSEGFSLFEAKAPTAILGKERAKHVFWKKAL
jgi:hypothetical protein